MIDRDGVVKVNATGPNSKQGEASCGCIEPGGVHRGSDIGDGFEM